MLSSVRTRDQETKDEMISGVLVYAASTSEPAAMEFKL